MRLVLNRFRRTAGHDVGVAPVQAHSRRANHVFCQPHRGVVRDCVWISFCHRRVAHQRTDRQLLESHQWHDHRHVDGHVRRVSCSGWTANAYTVLALTIGGVVCIAAAIAGATSQDLKTGYLVGATPYWQQIGLVIGVLVSSLAIGGTLILMNIGLAQYRPMQIPLDINNLPTGVERQENISQHEASLTCS